jgi:hypothetical protein
MDTPTTQEKGQAGAVLGIIDRSSTVDQDHVAFAYMELKKSLL